jgi:hypothetical protein
MRALGLCAALAAVIGSGAVLGAARPDVRQGKNAFIRGKLAGEARPGRPQELLTSSEKLPVAIVVETWDTLFASWVNQFRSTLTLDGSQRTTESLNQFWNGIMWMNFSSGLFTYDGANRDISRSADGFLAGPLSGDLHIRRAAPAVHDPQGKLQWDQLREQPLRRVFTRRLGKRARPARSHLERSELGQLIARCQHLGRQRA